ncbi:hypothetical protein FSP39_023752 [Pinctada imbricata]|uniref:B box-type domain-containing protein n=1 Tax=Pinctada imbricata TaxID=66713 RepID=A0AA89C0Z9_PINIB|nr:hypothetical protein FSP39_023752 [Pinctada imbricata]
MAASLHKAQFPLNLCEIHDKKELIGYCKTCQEKICSSCIKEKHTSHDWETITDILREKKHSLPRECKRIRSEQLPVLRKELCRFDRKIEEEGARFEQNKSSLNVSRQEYINEINRLFDLKIDECRNKSETAVNSFKEKRDALKQKVGYVDMMTTALDKDINTLPDHDILDMEKEMRNELEKALCYSADKYTCTTVFVPGRINIQALKDIVGEIHSVSMEEMRDIDKYTDTIMSVVPIANTHAWILTGGTCKFHPRLIDMEGEEMKTIGSLCTDFIISKNGDFILTSKTKCHVSVLTEIEDKISPIDTKPLHPTFVSLTENNDILVTMRDDGEQYGLVPTSRRIVQRLTLTGKVLNTYEFREDGKTRLFTFPVRTTENKNTDVCVVNWLSGSNGELVVLYKDGHVKFTYRGEGLKSETFMPSDVDSDSKCRILFTEKFTKAIHMLSAEGKYLCTLCQYEQIRPYVISLKDDDLWCGFKEGRIKVLKYKR